MSNARNPPSVRLDQLHEPFVGGGGLHDHHEWRLLGTLLGDPLGLSAGEASGLEHLAILADDTNRDSLEPLGSTSAS